MSTTLATTAYKEIAAEDLKVGDVYAHCSGDHLVTSVELVKFSIVNIRWDGGRFSHGSDETVCIKTDFIPQPLTEQIMNNTTHQDIAVCQLRLGDAVVDGGTPKIITQLTLAEDGYISVRWAGGFFMCEPSVMVRVQPKALQ